MVAYSFRIHRMTSFSILAGLVGLAVWTMAAAAQGADALGIRSLTVADWQDAARQEKPAGQDKPAAPAKAPAPQAKAPTKEKETPPALEKVITVEGITEYRLPNGLQVLLFPDASKPTVTVNVTYLVGSRHEGRGEAGMAHLLEHMVFKGTPTYKNIWGALEDHGAQFNGTTWVDRTNYFETLPATRENLEFALHMEADRMVNSLIAGEELAKEMTVVRNEFEMGENNPDGVLSERMMSSAYLWHNYGKSTIGNRSDIERVPVENLRKFYQTYYQPDNAMLVVAGKFEVNDALALIQQYFGSIPKPQRVLDKTYTEEPTQDGARFVELRRVGDVAAAGLMYHVPAGSHTDYPAVQILEAILTNQPAGRLYKALVETGKAASVSGAAYAWAEPGILELSASVRLDQDARGVLDEMTRLTEGVAEADITEEEVERIKTLLLKNIKLSLTDAGRIGVGLSNWAALGDWRMFFIHRDRLKDVTVADVKRAAKTFLVESNRTAGLFIPTQAPVRAEIPPTPAVDQIVKDYKGSETIDMGEAFAATPENIEKRTHRVTLENGIQAAFLAKETRGNAVRANFIFHFGTEADLTGHDTALQLIPTLMMRGTKDKDYQQLRDAIDKLQARINVFGGVGQVSGSIETDREHVVAAIELLGEILKQPAFAPDEFDTVIKQQLAAMEQGLSDPQARGFNALQRAMSPWPAESIHYVPTLEENIARTKAVSLGNIQELYTRFLGAGNLDVGVVGDFDEPAVTAAVNKAFGGWKSPSAYKRIEQPYRSVKPEDIVINTPDKPMAVVGTGSVIPLRDDDPDYPALNFATYILGSSAKSRLLNRLRHQGGLSYGAAGFLRADDEDQRALLMGYAICAPQNAAKAQDAMIEEFTKWITEGVTEEELTEGKTSYALKFENQIANDQFVVNQLASGLEIKRTFDYHAQLLKSVQGLTPDRIKAALKKHLGESPFVKMKAGDLAKQTGESEPAGEGGDAPKTPAETKG